MNGGRAPAGPGPGAAVSRRRIGGWYRRPAVVAYLFLSPTLAGLAVFRLYPVLESFARSFFRRSFASPTPIFVGFDGYRALLADPVFWKSAWVTLVFTAVATPIQIVLALGLALFLNVEVRGVRVVRSLAMLPIGVSLPIATVIFGIVLNPNSGLLNSALGALGVPAQPFLTSPRQALGSLVLIACWKGISYWMIFLLAGLKGIPEALYEAARLDGAGRLQVFWRITLPLLRRVVLFVVVADTISSFLLFIPAYLLTGGGPQLATNFLMFEAYRSGFVYLDMGRAMTIVSTLLVLLLAIIAVEFRFLRAQHEA